MALALATRWERSTLPLSCIAKVPGVPGTICTARAVADRIDIDGRYHGYSYCLDHAPPDARAAVLDHVHNEGGRGLLLPGGLSMASAFEVVLFPRCDTCGPLAYAEVVPGVKCPNCGGRVTLPRRA